MGSGDKPLAERAAAGAQKLEAAQRVKNAEEDERLQKDRERQAHWLARACTPPARGWLGFLGRKKADVDGERAWLAGLPFQVERYEDMFSGRLNDRRWAVRMQFVGAEPDAKLLTNLFANIATEVSVSTVRMTPDRRDPYAELKVPPEIDNSFDRNWHMRLLFHRVIDEVLRPLHAEYPLVAVEPGPDHHFDMRR